MEEKMLFEVMDRETDVWHSEHETLRSAMAAARTLKLAEVECGGESVAVIGGKRCKGCGEVCFRHELSGGKCDGCHEEDRWDEEWREENRGDFDC